MNTVPKRKWKSSIKKFSDHWIKDLNGREDLQISDGTIAGLYLRYSAKTKRISFYIMAYFKNSSTTKNIFLGRYPEYALREIRNKAIDVRRNILDGQIPAIIKEKEESKKHEKALKISQFTIQQIFEKYMEKYAKIYTKPRTQDSTRDLFRLHISPMFPNKPLQTIEDHNVMDAYATWAEKTSFNTANKILSVLSMVWKWAESYKYVPKNTNPCTSVKKGKIKKFQPQTLNADGYKALLKAFDRGIATKKYHPREFAALKVLMLTGCRSSEITGLERDELDLKEKTIRLKDSKTGARNVRLSDDVIPILKDALAEAIRLDSPYVFPSPVNPTWRPIVNIRTAFNWALKEAKLPPMRIHDLRHSFISMGANLGISMTAMKDVAGHTNISTTELYSHMQDQNSFVAVNNVTSAICGQ